MSDFIISEEDFERFAYQMIVTFPLMPDPMRKDWGERIMRVRSNKLPVELQKYQKEMIEVLDKWIEKNKYTDISSKSGTTFNEDGFNGYCMGRYAMGEAIQLQIKKICNGEVL